MKFTKIFILGLLFFIPAFTFAKNSHPLPCPYFINPLILKLGDKNEDVVLLQRFLKDYMGFSNLKDSGVFDEDTLVAVKTFQAKHMKDVMGPWGTSLPTGEVYITTIKKINEIACKKSVTFLPGELAKINNFRAGLSSTNKSQNITLINEQGNASDQSVIDSLLKDDKKVDNSDQTASASAPSSKFFRAITNVIGFFIERGKVK